MSALPINETTLEIVSSEKLISFIKIHLSNDPTLPKSIRRIITDTLPNNEQSTESNELSSFSSTERTFCKTQIKHKSITSKSTVLVEDKLQKRSNHTEKGKKIQDTVQPLGLNDLKWLHQAMAGLRKENNSLPYLHELIRNCNIVLPQNEILERNMELELRCQKLRREQEAREYEAITRNVDNVRTYMPQDTIAYQTKQINRQLIAVAQFIFSVLAGFAFGFIGVELIIGQLDFGFRLLLGIMIALIIALAEIYFLAKKLNEDHDVFTNLKPTKVSCNDKERTQIGPKNNLSFGNKFHLD